jgi:hypothetical protein
VCAGAENKYQIKQMEMEIYTTVRTISAQKFPVISTFCTTTVFLFNTNTYNKKASQKFGSVLTTCYNK